MSTRRFLKKAQCIAKASSQKVQNAISKTAMRVRGAVLVMLLWTHQVKKKKTSMSAVVLNIAIQFAVNFFIVALAILVIGSLIQDQSLAIRVIALTVITLAIRLSVVLCVQKLGKFMSALSVDACVGTCIVERGRAGTPQKTVEEGA